MQSCVKLEKNYLVITDTPIISLCPLVTLTFYGIRTASISFLPTHLICNNILKIHWNLMHTFRVIVWKCLCSIKKIFSTVTFKLLSGYFFCKNFLSFCVYCDPDQWQNSSSINRILYPSDTISCSFNEIGCKERFFNDHPKTKFGTDRGTWGSLNTHQVGYKKIFCHDANQWKKTTFI